MCENCPFGGRNYCWLCTFYSAIVTMMVVLCITWMIIFPQELKFSITDAWLEEFDLSQADNKTLITYNLALNITVGNPNKKIGVYFDKVQVMAKYRKRRFATVILSSSTELHRGRNNITLHSVLRGRETVKFNERDERQHRWETGSRVYNIDVSLSLVVRTKYGKISSGQFKPPKIDCDRLKVPLRSSSSSTHGTSDVQRNFKVRVCNNVFVLFSPEIDEDLML